MPERFALYYAPAPASPLGIKAALWLGRDAAGGKADAAEIEGLATEYRLRSSESARRYGFHATLKPPMVLAPGTTRAGLEAELERFTRERAPVRIGRIRPALIGGFLALIPVRQGAELTAFAAACVSQFEPYRASLPAAEREARIAANGLSTHQIDLLDRYGYPYVMDQFLFHMTLTDRLPEDARDTMVAAAERWFGPALEADMVLDAVSLFHEPEAGAPFMRVADFPLRAEAAVDA